MVTKQNSYSPEIRQLAYAMESMSHTERCLALLELADEQHKVGMKNGRFGYVPEKQLQLARIEAKINLLRYEIPVTKYKRSYSVTRANMDELLAALDAQKAHLTTKGGNNE